MNKIKPEKKADITSFLLNSFTYIILAALLCFNMHIISDFLRYEKVYQNPLVVTGTITEIEENEDSEGSTTYKAYITYSVDGTEYTSHFKSSNSRSSLPDYGDELTVEVNLDDPSELIKHMTNPILLIFSVPMFFAIAISIVCDSAARKMMNRESYADEETTRKNLFISVLTKPTGKIFLFLAITAAALYLRFPFIFDTWLIGIAGILFIIAACFIGKNIKRINHIKREEYKIVKSTIYDKYEKSDDDSTTYWLCYRDTEHEWKRSVSAKKYHSVEAGTTITSVYIGNAIRPEIVYDIDGTEKV